MLVVIGGVLPRIVLVALILRQPEKSLRCRRSGSGPNSSVCIPLTCTGRWREERWGADRWRAEKVRWGLGGDDRQTDRREKETEEPERPDRPTDTAGRDTPMKQVVQAGPGGSLLH